MTSQKNQEKECKKKKKKEKKISSVLLSVSLSLLKVEGNCRVFETSGLSTSNNK